MFKEGQIWCKGDRKVMEVVFIQPADWDEMNVKLYLSDDKSNEEFDYQDVSVSDTEAWVKRFGFTVKEVA